MAFRHAALAAALALLPLPGFLAGAAWAADAALTAALAPAHREAGNVARDKFRHPAESLEFWGLKPGLTVIEVSPGGGYWSEILAPYAKATGGHYVAAMGNASQKLPAKFNNAATYGAIGYTVFSNNSGPMTGGADLILTARNIHDWMWTPGFAEKSMRDFYAALKPGGILAVEDHRADPRPQIGDARDGYVATQHIIDIATAAGFRLEARSEINANPKDTKDHPFGVWTLPPTRRSANNGDDPKFDHTKYDAIGESDRMTLRFRKPG
jgi:predicted methyltransferase